MLVNTSYILDIGFINVLNSLIERQS